MERIDEIIEELRQKNCTSFDLFYNLTKNQVFYAIIVIIKDQSLAEDLMQDTYMKFLEKIDHYKNGSNVVAYLATIGRNLAINSYNRRKKEVRSEDIFETIAAPEVVEENEDIFKILELLNEDEKEIVVLHVINDLKFREIAVIIKKPLGTVLWIYNKAIKKLREKVGDVI